MYFSVRATKNNADKFSWWLFGDNKKIVAWAGQTWGDPESAAAEKAKFKEASESATYDVYADTGGHWRWRAVVDEEIVASSGESFDSKSNAQRAADNVREDAGSAEDR